jgi:prepilin-type processing-associated H-X9-DG protein
VGQNIERANEGEGNKGRYNVYKCPSAPWLTQKFNVTPKSPDEKDGKTHEGFAYTMNETGWAVKSGPVIPSTYNRLKDSQVAVPSKMIFVAEGMGWQYYGVGYGSGKVYDNEKFDSEAGWVSNNPPADEDIPLSQPNQIGRLGGSLSKVYNIRVSHNGGAMCMFYDGHVELRNKTKGINWTSKPVQW